MAPGLTGAQRDACFQVLDRLGYLEGRKEQLARTSGRIDSARASAAAEPPTSAEGREWYDATLVVVDQLADETERGLADARRAQHALMSVSIAFCQPEV